MAVSAEEKARRMEERRQERKEEKRAGRRIARQAGELTDLQQKAADAAAERVTPAYFEAKFQIILDDYLDAIRAGDHEAAVAAADAKEALSNELFGALMGQYSEAAQAGTPPNLDSSPLFGMYHNLQSFVLTRATAASDTSRWGRPGQVVDTPEEKLRGWGLNDAQIAQWNEYDAAIQAGKTPEQAAAAAGVSAQQAAGWATVTSWEPVEWSRHYNESLGGQGEGLPAREGAAQLGANPLYTTVPGRGVVTEPVTPTYGGIGAGLVPGTLQSWSGI